MSRSVKEMEDALAESRKQTAELERKIAEARVRMASNPPPEYNDFAVDIQFTRYGRIYHYLLTRCAGKWYTTGTGDHAMFANWSRVVEWLDSVYAHSAMTAIGEHPRAAEVFTAVEARS